MPVRIDHERRPTNRYLDNSHTKEQHVEEMKRLRKKSSSNQRAYYRHLADLCEKRGIEPVEVKYDDAWGSNISWAIESTINKLVESGMTREQLKPRDKFVFDKKGRVVKKSSLYSKSFDEQFDTVNFGEELGIAWRRKDEQINNL